jgi:hypothetical protein
MRFSAAPIGITQAMSPQHDARVLAGTFPTPDDHLAPDAQIQEQIMNTAQFKELDYRCKILALQR